MTDATLPRPHYHDDGTITIDSSPGKIVALWRQYRDGFVVVWPAGGTERDGEAFAAHPRMIADRHIWRWLGLAR